MSDVIVTPPPPPVLLKQTDPTARAKDTLEGKLTIAAAIFSGLVAAASAFLPFLTTAFPDAAWVASAAGIVAGLGTMLGVVTKLTGGRSTVKAEMVRAGAVADYVEAAKTTNP